MSQIKYSLFNEHLHKIAKLFFSFPHRSFHVRLIARETGLSTTTAIRSLRALEKMGIIKVEKGLITSATAALDRDEYASHKRISNMEELRDSGLIDELKKMQPEAIVVFGSYSRGEDIEESDIDLLILTKKGIPSMSSYERRLARKISVHTSIGENKEFRNALANGIVLYGYLKIA